MLDAPSNLGHVLVAEAFDERGLEVLRAAGARVTSVAGLGREALERELGLCDALIVRSETRVDGALIARAPRLRVVARAGVGVDAIDVDAATAAGIIVLNTPAANTLAATEHTFALLFGVMRHVSAANASVHRGEWNRAPFVGHELHGKTLGIIGFGRIGSNVAVRAQAFGMRVIACDPFVAAARATAANVELVSLETLLSRSDVVTLHVPLTEQTQHMIGDRTLALMRDDAVLINCARGAVVSPDALLRALDTGRLRGVAVDVVPQEPPPPDSASRHLLEHPRVVATPHLGGSTHEALARIALELAADVVRALGGLPALGAVNAPVLTGSQAQLGAAFVEAAFRIGRLAPQLYPGALQSELALLASGEIYDLPEDPFVASFFAGLLSWTLGERVTTVNALRRAADSGLRATVVRDRNAAPYQSTIGFAAGHHRVIATVLHGGARIVSIDGFDIDAVASGHMVMTRHRDVPGIVGRIGTILGNAGINISTMQVARTGEGGDAIMMLGIDRGVPFDVRDAIARVDGIEQALAVHL